MPAVNYLWDPIEDNIIAEYDDDGNVIVEYTTEPGLHGAVISERRNGVSRFHIRDGDGNTVALTDEQGNVTDTFGYTAGGELTERTGTTPTPYQYKSEYGYYTDQTTGQIMVRRRDYDPAQGRWLSPDPAKMLDDLNRFTYVKNNPLALIDPSGMQSEGRYRKSTSVYLDCPSDCLPVFADGCRFRLTSFALYFGVGKDPPTVRHWSLKLAATPGIVPFTSLLVEETKEYFRRIGPNYYCAYLRSCFSDFDRTYTPSSFIKVTLLDGTECLFTERNFPGGMYVDDNTLPAACRGLLDFKPIRLEDPDEPVLIGGGTYHLTREVKSVVYAFDITVHCGCYLAREPDQNLAPRNQAVLTIRGSVPGDPPDRIGD